MSLQKEIELIRKSLVRALGIKKSTNIWKKDPIMCEVVKDPPTNQYMAHLSLKLKNEDNDDEEQQFNCSLYIFVYGKTEKLAVKKLKEKFKKLYLKDVANKQAALSLLR